MVMSDVTGLKLLEIPVVEQTKTPPLSTRNAAPSALQLLSFYQSLSHWERINRFGCAMSDEAIRAWRCSLSPWYSKSILWPHGRRPLGIVEIFGSLDEEWICPEMAVCVLEEAASANPLHNLFTEGLAAASRLGASYVRLYFNRSETSIQRLATLHGGELNRESGVAVVPCDPTTLMWLREPEDQAKS
jgi:hypothetical protein